ncbi:MAG TPA: transaldolase [Nitratifractor sp.]|jgi:transaldolase|nr:transaldolase [Nitratifractor sp.]
MVDETTGFSLWVDFIEREFIETKFKEMIESQVIDGATSNPSIFANAIMKSPAYKEQLKTLEGKSAKEKYEALAIADIKAAAQKLRVCYDSGYEGYISIEVDPFLSNNTEGTIEEGTRLFKAIDEPNVMIKVPATEAGYAAMKELTERGISVNATLIFSPDQALRAAKAIREGIKEFELSGGGRVEGVISVFVSRFDRKLDSELEKLGVEKAKTGILNAAKIYNLIRGLNEPAIKTLFASTGVKPEQGLSKDYYVTELCARHSINTAPIETIEAYEASGNKGKLALPIAEETIEAHFEKLAANGIDIGEVYESLMQEGLVAFENSFADMLKTLE